VDRGHKSDSFGPRPVSTFLPITEVEDFAAPPSNSHSLATYGGTGLAVLAYFSRRSDHIVGAYASFCLIWILVLLVPATPCHATSQVFFFLRVIVFLSSFIKSGHILVRLTSAGDPSILSHTHLPTSFLILFSNGQRCEDYQEETAPEERVNFQGALVIRG
jgi:hypothetical protein